ncbi:MAG: SDR family NAD(P)-dependent oxidoreductase [Candidatus Bathyarchaeia archaeon]
MQDLIGHESMVERVKGKVAVVTGASRGIGFAVSKVFTFSGMKVYMASRNKDRLEEAAREIRGVSNLKGYPEAVQADVSDESDVKRLFYKISQEEGRLDVLVNNAGTGVFKPFLETKLQDLQKVFKVNVQGVFLCCKEAFKLMMNLGGGCIVNVGSIVSLRGYPNQSVYAASKHALLGLTKVLAEEGKAYNIRVMAICPGGVRTDLARKLLTIRPDLKPEVLMDPEDVANTILYMIAFSDKASIDNIVIRRRASSPYF